MTEPAPIDPSAVNQPQSPERRPAALDALERRALAADMAEKRFRAGIAAEIDRLEAARRHAFRRYAFLKALIAADAASPDRETSIAAQTAAAAGELDWDEIDDARRPVLEALAPLAAAVHARRTDGQGAAPDEADPILDALDAFEAWHLAARSTPFETLFDRYVQETPLVDF